MPTYDVPGVYIEEQTGPGVIAGVGTSTAAFIGPALRGTISEAQRISSYDEFLEYYAASQSDGTYNPYITSPRWFYMAHAVKGFFENGGRQAYIVRVGTALATVWNVDNQDGELVFQVRAREDGVSGDSITVQVQEAHATGASGVTVATGQANVSDVDGTEVTVDDSSPFRVGDIVTEDESARATINQIQGDVLTLSATISNLDPGDTLRIANIIPAQSTFRVTSTTGLWAGSVVIISQNGTDDYAVIESVDSVGFVTLASSPARIGTFDLTLAAIPVVISQEFRLIITPPGVSAETFDNLSLNPRHPGYVFYSVDSDHIEILSPDTPPTASDYPNCLVNAVGNVAIAIHGQDDNPASLTAIHYENGLHVLADIDDVNIVCIPDAAAHSECITIQNDMINHCLDLKDRFAILDSQRGAAISGSGSIEEHRESAQSEGGFAALYYPWLEVRDPTSTGIIPSTMLIPPSGHIAGVYARTDGERGVHKAPANVQVRGVLGLERRLSDGQHGPLNLDGINVLRIFPGSAQVLVWGARTTVDPDITDWLYVNVRRLMLYIEESIEEGIRWAVFEPNNLNLWQKLKRTISEFLTRLWRDGALFGDSADKAFYVRIDEALNPASTRAIGRLYIEIGVAVVCPAEFIIVRIGLWDGGSEVSES